MQPRCSIHVFLDGEAPNVYTCDTLVFLRLGNNLSPFSFAQQALFQLIRQSDKPGGPTALTFMYRLLLGTILVTYGYNEKSTDSLMSLKNFDCWNVLSAFVGVTCIQQVS